MPVYLCKPGWSSPEPWCHGVQVYAYPFYIDDTTTTTSSASSTAPSPSNTASTASRHVRRAVEDRTRNASAPSRSRSSAQSTAMTTTTAAVATAAAVAAAAAAVSNDRGDDDEDVYDDRNYSRTQEETTSEEHREGDARASNNNNPSESDDEPPPPPHHHHRPITRPSSSHHSPSHSPSPPPTSSRARSPATSPPGRNSTTATAAAAAAAAAVVSSSQPPPPVGIPVRRVRHAEVVLVDEVSASFGRYWLRLRWPGPRGGVAGYIALGPVGEDDDGRDDEKESGGKRGIGMKKKKKLEAERSSRPRPEDTDPLNNGIAFFSDSSTPLTIPDSTPSNPLTSSTPSNPVSLNQESLTSDSKPPPAETPSSSRRNSESPMLRSSEEETTDLSTRPLCESTGLYFPTSSAMELLASYDDGLSSVGGGSLGDGLAGQLHASLTGDQGEPVFCRICREGLHDVNYDLDTGSGETSGKKSPQITLTGTGGNPNVAPPPPPRAETLRELSENIPDDTLPESEERPQHRSGLPLSDDPTKTTSTPPLPILKHHPSAENPLMAPCECSGSMAFVHYLCVEQWRCRSRHPAALNGLNCETCGAPYKLSPPVARPTPSQQQPNANAAVGVLAEEDWLEAMPAHVLAALRRPHFWWQVGAALVRRRWLRPFAPVILSPVVALYCRARRMLKKRGVSRRRWACSLCRRRARWKCVRCLRSYYCSRQCQNVSWHIVHKHVCYKPARLWWSVFVYGAGTVLACPGILKNPLIYDLGVMCLVASFICMGVIGGGIATALKRGLGFDIRGRALEFLVVLLTLWLSTVSWGLVWAFFGEENRCGWGFGGASGGGGRHQGLRKFVFGPAKTLLVALDGAFLGMGERVQKLLCANLSTVTNEFSDASSEASGTLTTEREYCFHNIHAANPDFFTPELGGSSKCSSDLNTVCSVWVFSAAVLVLGTVLKKRDRERRANGRGGGRVRMRPHQD